MTRLASLPILAAMFGLSAASAQPAGGAGIGLRNAQGQMVGGAVAARRGNAMHVAVTVRGFRPGIYAVHLHQSGRCDAPDFASAGPHWNPTERQHGRLNPQGPHLGDLPNLRVLPNGTGRIDFDVPVPAGTAADANPLSDADGTSIVIHAAADDERTDPSGNSGARIACGILAPVR